MEGRPAGCKVLDFFVIPLYRYYVIPPDRFNFLPAAGPLGAFPLPPRESSPPRGELERGLRGALLKQFLLLLFGEVFVAHLLQFV